MADDLELTKACAEAMFGGDARHDEDGSYQRLESVPLFGTNTLLRGEWVKAFDPLHDDAQAMALVKKFRLEIFYEKAQPVQPWCICKYHAEKYEDNCFVQAADLNRAIVECVAKMKGSA